LAAGIDVHVLNPDRLFAAALELGEGFGLHRECPQELGSQSAVGPSIREAFALRHARRPPASDGDEHGVVERNWRRIKPKDLADRKACGS
jgi:hypothetical protein